MPDDSAKPAREKRPASKEKQAASAKRAVKKPQKPGASLFSALMTAPALCFFYPLTVLVLLIVYHFVSPQAFWAQDSSRFLPIYRSARIVTGALLDWIKLFPALILSALVMPFGLNPDFETPEKRFSKAFFLRMRPCIFSAMCAAAVFGILTMLAYPALNNHYAGMRANSAVYYAAKNQAEAYAQTEDWAMALGFLSLCKKIWPKDNTELIPLEERVRTGREQLLYGRAARPESGNLGARALPGQKQPVNAVQAVEFANKALDEDRVYDAHWLATLAVRLAAPGSAELSAGQRIAAWSWNRIALLEPGEGEERLATIYRQKRAGYEAMLAEDWLRAYYIFHELALIVPGDPDVERFHSMSREGLKYIVFFIDEMNRVASEEIENAVFSLPRIAGDGRLVMRTGYFSANGSESYASRVELAAFDRENKPVFFLETPFAKIMPVQVNNQWRTGILLRSVDRDDERIRWDPLWSTPEGQGPPAGAEDYGGYELLLDIAYEDFLLAAEGTAEQDVFFLADFWKAAVHLGDYGYAPEVFQAGILRTLGAPLIFLPLAIFAIVLGWRFRSRHRPPFAGLPMAVILPIVFYAVVALVMSTMNTIYIMLILSLGFTAALILSIAFAVIFLVLSLLSLAAQQG